MSTASLKDPAFCRQLSRGYNRGMASEVRFSEVRKLLESKGWAFIRISGSHHIFKKPGVPEALSVPVHGGKVKPVYVKKNEKL